MKARKLECSAVTMTESQGDGGSVKAGGDKYRALSRVDFEVVWCLDTLGECQEDLAGLQCEMEQLRFEFEEVTRWVRAVKKQMENQSRCEEAKKETGRGQA